MAITNQMADQAILSALGSRLARIRLNQNVSQAALAELAGVTPLTVHNIESGANANMRSVIRVMRALGIAGNLEAAFPELPVSPIQAAEREARQRRKASGNRRRADSA